MSDESEEIVLHALAESLSDMFNRFWHTDDNRNGGAWEVITPAEFRRVEDILRYSEQLTYGLAHVLIDAYDATH